MEKLQGTLFIDPQDECVIRFCPVCGACRYPPTFTCIRCLRDSP